jgi:hypothetical protein
LFDIIENNEFNEFDSAFEIGETQTTQYALEVEILDFTIFKIDVVLSDRSRAVQFG